MSSSIRPNRLKEIAGERGISPIELVVATVKEVGSVNGAAIHLGVARNTIRYWMKKSGYTTTTRRVATVEPVVSQAV